MGTVNKLISKWTDKAGILKRNKGKETNGAITVSGTSLEHAEGQEYLNAEIENRRFNEMLGISTISSAYTSETTDSKKEQHQQQETDMKTNQNNAQSSSSSRKQGSQRSHGTGHWRGRSKNYRSMNRNYERGFEDGYRAAMQELQGGSHHRFPSDGEFRFNERSESQVSSREQRSSSRNTENRNKNRKRDRQMDYSFPQERKRNEKVSVDVGHGDVHSDSHKTGKFFIEQHAGKSKPYNSKLARNNQRKMFNSRMTKTGWKRMH